MKRMLVWLTLLAMFFTMAPMASAGSAPAYAKGDVMAAVSGVGRMPSNYYNLAGIALDSIAVSPAQAETFTKKLYQVWAFLSKHAYAYDGSQSIQGAMTKEQWTAITDYASKLAWEQNNAAINGLLLDFLTKTKANKLVKPGVPRSLLGVRFDAAAVGAPATVKVYTTTDVAGGVSMQDASGKVISAAAQVKRHQGTLAAFNEHILTVQYQYVGANAVRLHGVDADDAGNFFSTKVTASGPDAGGSTGANPSAKVTKVSAKAVDLGNASLITVTTSASATCVKVTNKKGVLLASSDVAVTTAPKTFVVPYCFSAAGTQAIRVYAGTVSGSAILWNKTYKTAKVKVNPAASGAKVSKVTASGALRGQEAAIKVYASAKTTRVQILDASGDVVDATRAYVVSGKLRVFTLKYRGNAVGSHKLFAQAGDDVSWKAAKKKFAVKFTAPAVAKILATKVRRGTASTITVTGPSTATRARLYNAKKALIAEVAISGGSFVFTWTQGAAGKKTIYARVYDGVVWGPYKAGKVTFT